MSLTVGQILTFERTFTRKDVEMFTELSGDEGIHHLTPDEQGKVVIQGLLTATLPTKIGGDNHVLARTMNFHFIKPVLTEEKIVCEVRIDKFEKRKNNKVDIMASFNCKNNKEQEVLKGEFSGIILEY